MAKFGIIHPPAGGSAFTFASGSFGWHVVLVYIIGILISILTAVFINNWSVERQYPIYWWGLKSSFFPDVCRRSRRRKDQGPASKKV
jgi:CBS-domain-containing membrane protein